MSPQGPRLGCIKHEQVLWYVDKITICNQLQVLTELSNQDEGNFVVPFTIPVSKWCKQTLGKLACSDVSKCPDLEPTN